MLLIRSPMDRNSVIDEIAHSMRDEDHVGLLFLVVFGLGLIVFPLLCMLKLEGMKSNCSCLHYPARRHNHHWLVFRHAPNLCPSIGPLCCGLLHDR